MLQKAREIGTAIKRELKAYQFMANDPRTPWVSRVLLGLAVGYALLPIDLIPDFIPVLGLLDDVIIIPGLVILALKFVPKEVIEEARKKSSSLP